MELIITRKQATVDYRGSGGITVTPPRKKAECCLVASSTTPASTVTAQPHQQQQVHHTTGAEVPSSADEWTKDTLGYLKAEYHENVCTHFAFFGEKLGFQASVEMVLSIAKTGETGLVLFL